MSNDKKSQVHKMAVLEFLYGTAARAIGNAALVAIEAQGNHAKADAMLREPLTRDGFAAGVRDELRQHHMTVEDAPVGAVVEAGSAVAKRLIRAADETVGEVKPRIVVLEVPAAPGDNPGIPDAFPGSNDFGSN
jgi:hypothetical protein